MQHGLFLAYLSPEIKDSRSLTLFRARAVKSSEIDNTSDATIGCMQLYGVAGGAKMRELFWSWFAKHRDEQLGDGEKVSFTVQMEYTEVWELWLKEREEEKKGANAKRAKLSSPQPQEPEDDDGYSSQRFGDLPRPPPCVFWSFFLNRGVVFWISEYRYLHFTCKGLLYV
jgi:hypothetical protein